MRLRTNIMGGKAKVRCKLEVETMVSNYEIEVINRLKVPGLMFIERVGSDLLFTCPETITLARYLSSAKGKISMTSIAMQLICLVEAVREARLDDRKICLNPSYIFIESKTGNAHFIYLPINGYGNFFDPVLFLKDITSNAMVMQDSWYQRLLSITKVEELISLKSYVEKGVGIQFQQQITGMEEKMSNGPVPGKQGMYTTKSEEFDEEAPTDIDIGLDTADMDIAYMEEDWGDDPVTTFDEVEQEEMTAIDEIEEEMATDLDEASFRSSCQRGSIEANSLFIKRLSTGEEKSVNHFPYTMGRSHQRADFIIDGNSKIGNVHVKIVKQRDGYYLEDNSSRNGTFVNGSRLESGDKIKLVSEMQFQLHNEVFQVKYR